MDFFCKSQRFGKSLETFGLRIFFLRFKKSKAGMDFPMDFLLFSRGGQRYFLWGCAFARLLPFFYVR